MRRNTSLWPAAVIAVLLTASGAVTIHARQDAQPARANIYAQKLIDDTLAKHPEVVTLAMHVTPPNNPDNIIIASNFGKLGKKADEDDLGVLKTGRPRAEVGRNGDRFSVELPLQDLSGHTVGVLAVAFPYKAGDDKGKFLKQAEHIRDKMKKKIPSLEKLFEPSKPGTARR
ncbi:MAG: hypothetical protein QOC99_320 [Acidobacteriota bacterium]|nr:hypothetical protein [Acidobacteriota bacterium]